MSIREFNKRLVEVDEVLNQISPKYVMQIPENIRKFIRENRDKEYMWKYDKTKDFKDQNINEDTLALLAYLNTEYMLNEEQRKVIKQIYYLNQQKSEREKEKKYNSNIQFKNKDKKVENELVKYNDSLFKKLKEMIQKIFHLKQ